MRKKSSPHETLFWRQGGKCGLRHGDWKIVRMGGRKSPGKSKWELYDLSNDPGETHNLFETQSELAKELEEKGIKAEVINIHTIKPLDDEAILNSIKKTRCVVTCEEHNYLGGLGESVSGLLAKNDPVYQEFVATNDTFGESGTPAQLMEKYGLNTKSIVEAVNRVLAKK